MTAIRGLNAADIWNHENAFYWFSHPSRINKMLAHYDLYHSIAGLPGDVFELGVYKGASLIRLATFRAMLESSYSRKIVGFDAFGKFPTDSLTLRADLDFIDRFEGEGGEGLSREEVAQLLNAKGFDNFQLHAGNVFDTLPAYLEANPATRIAFLHLDMDVKEPTAFALDLLYDRIVPGGLIVLDDYGSVAGETDAVDAFAAARELAIEKLSHSYAPAFIRKAPKARLGE